VGGGVSTSSQPDGPLIALGATLGLLGVAAGAFGAHALEGLVTPERLAVFETGARYHLIHAVAIVVAGIVAGRLPPARLAGWLWSAGVLIFAGSLYLLVLLDAGWLGAVTPLGGLALMGGWGVMAWAGWEARRRHDRPSSRTSSVPLR